MFVTLKDFFDNFRIRNGDKPNETVFNRPLFRLKREIRELKSIVDILSGVAIETWSASKYYERDEYVTFRDKFYRSTIDGNVGHQPNESATYWVEEFANLSFGSGGTDTNTTYTFDSDKEYDDLEWGTVNTICTVTDSYNDKQYIKIKMPAKPNETTVSNKNATLSWGTAVTVANVSGTDIKVSLPAKPNESNVTVENKNATLSDNLTVIAKINDTEIKAKIPSGKYTINTQQDDYTTTSSDFDGNTIIRMNKNGTSTLTLTKPDESFIGSTLTVRKTNGDQNSLLYISCASGVTISPGDISPIRRVGSTISLLYIGDGLFDAFGELP